MSEERFTLHIMPAQKCVKEHNTCERMTNYAEATIVQRSETGHSNELVLYPACYEHGYFYLTDTPTQAERAQEYASVERNVIGSHDGKGRAIVIGHCPLSDVPDYKPYEPLDLFVDMRTYNLVHMDDIALYVRYELGSSTQHFYVTWSFDAIEFATWGEVKNDEQ